MVGEYTSANRREAVRKRLRWKSPQRRPDRPSNPPAVDRRRDRLRRSPRVWCLYLWNEMSRVLIFAALVVLLPARGHAKPPLDASVCTIAAHPSMFHNKTVRIHARAVSGYEAAFLMDANEETCPAKKGIINLHLDSAEHDETTDNFLRLFGTEMTYPPCDRDKELSEALAHALDPKAPAPKLCVDTVCFHCPRYNITATFTGKLRWSGREPGHAHFGHLGMFTLQLDVKSVTGLHVADTQPLPMQ